MFDDGDGPDEGTERRYPGTCRAGTRGRPGRSIRLRTAGALLRRCWMETRLQDPLPPEALDVWAGVRLRPQEATA